MSRNEETPTAETSAASPESHQDPPGRVQGTVVQRAGGRPVAGARVQILQEGIVTDLQFTNSQGRFASRLLFAGDYALRATADGFAPAVREGVTVRLGHTTEVHFRMDPAPGAPPAEGPGAGPGAGHDTGGPTAGRG